MPIKYIGPQTLEGVYQKVYSEISKHYERGNPVIVVGVPTPIDFLDDERVFKSSLTKFLGAEAPFSTQQEFNEYVDIRVARLTEFLERASKVKKSRYKALDKLYQEGELAFKEVFKELEKISFAEVGRLGSMAEYRTADDCIYVDVYGTAVYFFGGVIPSHIDVVGYTNIPQILRHELVHHDIGECEPSVEMRGYYKEAMYFFKTHEKGREAAKNGVEAVKKWRKEEGGEEFLLRLEKAQGEITPEGFKREVYELGEQVKKVVSKSDGLGIGVGNEALAYVYVRDKDSFKGWLRNIKFAQESRALDLYDSLERRVNQQGELKTLREVKEAINTAYSGNTNLLNLI